MKKLALISLSLIFAMSIFGQVSEYPPKTVVITMGEKHPDFDESKYPNVDFYYVIKEKYKQPEGLLYGLNEGDNLLFGKNGVLIRTLKYKKGDLGESFYAADRKKVVTDDQEFDYTYLDDYAKTYIKKGKTIKEKSVKSKHPEKFTQKYFSCKLPNFKITDLAGKEFSFNDIFGDSPLTLISFVYFDSWNSINKGAEAGWVKEIKTLNEIASK